MMRRNRLFPNQINKIVPLNTWDGTISQYNAHFTEITFSQNEYADPSIYKSHIASYTDLLKAIDQHELMFTDPVTNPLAKEMKRDLYLWRGHAKKKLHDEDYITDFQMVLCFDPDNETAQHEITQFGCSKSCCTVS